MSAQKILPAFALSPGAEPDGDLEGRGDSPIVDRIID